MRRSRWLSVATGALLAGAGLSACSQTERDRWIPPSAKSRTLLAELRAEADRANRRVAVPFDPASQHLVIPHVSRLVAEYGLPIGFEQLGTRDSPEFRAYRLIDPVQCAPIEALRGRESAGLSVQRVGDRASGAGEPDPRACVLQTEQAPSLPVVQVTRDSDEVRRGGKTFIRKMSIISLPDGRSYRLVDYDFDRQSSPKPRREDVPGALGLRRVAALDAMPSGPAPPPQPAELLARRVEAQRGLIESLLAGQWTPGGVELDPTLLRERPEMVRPLTDRLMARLEAERARPDPDPYDRSDGALIKALHDLVAVLPEAELQRLSPRLLDTLARTGPTVGYGSEALVERLGELGPRALPVLEAMSKGVLSSGHGVDPFLLSVCRIGTPGAAGLGPGLMGWWREANEPVPYIYYGRAGLLRHRERHGLRPAQLNPTEALLYVTLRRLGLGAEAEAEARHNRRGEYERRGADVGPGSPPAVCTPDSVRQG